MLPYYHYAFFTYTSFAMALKEKKTVRLLALFIGVCLDTQYFFHMQIMLFGSLQVYIKQNQLVHFCTMKYVSKIRYIHISICFRNKSFLFLYELNQGKPVQHLKPETGIYSLTGFKSTASTETFSNKTCIVDITAKIQTKTLSLSTRSS